MAQRDRYDSDDDLDDIDNDLGLRDPENINKYKFSAEIANKVLAIVVRECAPGKKILDLASLGDKLINEEVKNKYTKIKDKGVAFPTSISINNCVGHYSPLSSDTTLVQEGDVVKVDLGVHIDGIVAVVAHTLIATTNLNEPVSGKKADVICAAHFAAECALRLLRPGNKNTDVTNAIQKVATAFHCNPVEGVLSHELKKFLIDGEKVIINKQTLEQRVDEFVFEENEVYAVDIVMSTGDGKTKELESRTTIYKRALDQNYLLKLKASRYVFNEISNRFTTFPFTLRALDESRAKLGIVECLNHGLVHPYPVLYEKQGEYVAQFKFTVLILPTSTEKITSHPLPFVKSDYSIVDEDIKKLLTLGLKRKTNKKPKNKKKKKKTTTTTATATTTATTTATPAASSTTEQKPEPMDTN